MFGYCVIISRFTETNLKTNIMTLKEELKQTMEKALEIAEMLNDDGEINDHMYGRFIAITEETEKL